MLHVILDLYQCNPDLLENEAYLRLVLQDLPRQIGMQQVGPVELRHIGEVTNPNDAGYSGFVIIASSHCSLHAWKPYKMVNMDVFSCNPFDPAVVIAFAQERFETTDSEVQVVERAVRSPRPPSFMGSPSLFREKRQA
jgi:S-adenosylmethionine decarboxylase